MAAERKDSVGGDRARQYWRKNLILIGGLLAVWFLVSFVFAIFLAEAIYGWRVGRLPASFWWAQQGSMFVFVLLVFVYARWMDRLDRRYGASTEDAGKLEEPGGEG